MVCCRVVVSPCSKIVPTKTCGGTVTHWRIQGWGWYGKEVLYQGDLHTTGDDSDLIYVHTRVRVGPTSHKSYSITNWCE